MGKVRKKVEQPEFRSSRTRRTTKRKFTANRYTKKQSDDVVVVENSDTNEQNNSVNNSSVNNSSSVAVDFSIVDNVNNDNVPGPSTCTVPADGDEIDRDTVTGRKLSQHPLELPKKRTYSDGLSEFSDNEIMDMGILSQMISILSCPECNQVGVKILHEKRYGLATKCKILCRYCDFAKEFWSSSKVEGGRTFDVNERLVYAMRSIGKGLGGAQTFLPLMNLPAPVKKSAYNKIKNKIHVAVKEVATEVMQDAAEELREVSGVVNEDEIADTAISCDGTWQKRGFTSLNGAVVVMSIETGKVLDIEVMSRYCQSCVSNEHLKETDTEKFEEFQASHECGINHKGSAPAMEMKGTIKIFERSVKKNKMRYMNFYGDGDTKSFTAIENIYPDYRKVQKFECVGHVQKRMGKRLRTLRKTVKGLGGRGRLTDAMVDKLQNYYGIAIRRNKGKDVATMKRAIWGSFFHVCSSKDKQWHDHCEAGPNSWCRYQVDLVNNTNTYKPGPGLPGDIITHIKPILADLTTDSLLLKCLHGKTQNQNESFNGTIWNRLPKGTYVGLLQLEIGVYDAVAHFNIGSKAAVLIYEKLGIRPGLNMIQGCMAKNTARKENAHRQSMDTKKTKRRWNRGEKKRSSDKTKAKEGKTYGAGAFE